MTAEIATPPSLQIHSAPILQADGIGLTYDRVSVSRDLDVSLPEGRISVIIGPNGCGKSTLLRALAGVLKPTAGQVLLEGRPLHGYSARERARMLGLLPQVSVAPSGIRVADLVSRGRFPHQGLLSQWSEQDDRAVNSALALTHLASLAGSAVDELSGGQRQRVWLALVLAQNPRVMLLDEPTTYLDIAHQYEVLELCRQLNRREGRTLVMVLHDLNQTARYADHILAMKDGRIAAAGSPDQVIRQDVLTDVFGIEVRVVPDPVTHTPMVVPVPTAL